MTWEFCILTVLVLFLSYFYRTRDSGSLFHLQLHCGTRDFRDSIAFINLMRSPADFYETRQSDWRRQVTECTNFGSNLANIRIRINRQIRIRLRDHCWLRFWPWRRSVLSECSLFQISVDYCIIVVSQSVSCQHFCRAMLYSTSAAYAVMRVSVRLSVTFVDSVKTSNRIFKILSPSGTKIIFFNTTWNLYLN